jgi:predicted amidohydrolase YtcJ
MLVYSAADFEDFREPRPELPPQMEAELEGVVRILVQNRWPWRLHATYDQTISRALDVYERVNRDMPLQGLHWFFDHAETSSEQSIDRIAALGGGIAVQHRMAYQGEYFVERYGARAAEATPPVARMLEQGLRVAAGTDATRVASHNPWVSLAWLVTGRTVGGLRIYPQRNCVDRETALRLWTENATWFSNEEGKKGRIEAGQLADLIVPDRDFFTCAESDIADTVSELTMVGGRIVYAAGIFASLDTCCRQRCRIGRRCRFGGSAASAEQRDMEIHRRRLDEAGEVRQSLPCSRPRSAEPGLRTPRRPRELLGRAWLLVLRVLGLYDARAQLRPAGRCCRWK